MLGYKGFQRPGPTEIELQGTNRLIPATLLFKLSDVIRRWPDVVIGRAASVNHFLLNQHARICNAGSLPGCIRFRLC
jgi:hypothetical protein